MKRIMKKENERIMLGSLLGGPIGTGIAIIINKREERKKEILKQAMKDLKTVEVKTVDVKTVDV